jgi:hypothetical protein
MEWRSQNWTWLLLAAAAPGLLLYGRAASAAGRCKDGHEAGNAVSASGNGARRLRISWILAGAAAIALYSALRGHRIRALEYLPYLILLACPLLHLFMHKGDRHSGHHHNAPKDPPK